MKLDPDYEYTKKDLQSIRRRTNRKKRRVILQAIILVLLVGSFFHVVFSKDIPQPLTPAPNQWTQRDGFIAVSYGGLARKEKEGGKTVSRQLFENHMRALKEAGYNVITTQDVIDYCWNDAPLPDRALYLMFEGGRKDSAIFGQEVLANLNLRATMYIQTARLTGWNRFFIRSTELEALSKNPYWEIGSQGYELRHINVMEDEGYQFYLTDYLRDAYRNPIETDAELRKRIEDDYELSYYPIEKYTDKKPEAYIFMPANMLWRSLEGTVEQINAEMLDKYYKVVFAREGPCYNTKQTAPFNLTRMQIYPDWSINKLLMEIESWSPNRHTYQQADEDQYRLWQTDAGALASDAESLILTSPKDRDAFSWLRGTDTWDNADVSVYFTGSARGVQKLYMRYSSFQSNICITLSRNNLMVLERVPRRGTNILYETFLDYNKDSEGNIRPDDQAEKPEKFQFTLIGNRLTIRYGEKGSLLTKDAIPISWPVQRGRIALGAQGEDEPYDAVFDKLQVKPINHRWILPDPVTDSEILRQAASGDKRTCVMIPVSGENPEWTTRGPNILYRALSEGEMAFAMLPAGNYDIDSIDQPWATVPLGAATRFWSGVLLTPQENPDWKTISSAANKAREREMEVAIRLTHSTATSLASSPEELKADWVIYDFKEPLPKDIDTKLKTRFDRRHFLQIPKDNPGVPQIYTWIGE